MTRAKTVVLSSPGAEVAARGTPRENRTVLATTPATHARRLTALLHRHSSPPRAGCAVRPFALHARPASAHRRRDLRPAGSVAPRRDASVDRWAWSWGRIGQLRVGPFAVNAMDQHRSRHRRHRPWERRQGRHDGNGRCYVWPRGKQRHDARRRRAAHGRMLGGRRCCLLRQPLGWMSQGLRVGGVRRQPPRLRGWPERVVLPTCSHCFDVHRHLCARHMHRLLGAVTRDLRAGPILLPRLRQLTCDGDGVDRRSAS
jgi:hypothetical protein